MVVGNGYGYGYGEEGGGPIIEQTSSSPSHYEIMALVHLLAAGLGVTDGEGDEPYLRQIRDSLAEIKGILQQSHDASEVLRAEALTVLEAHTESAQQYMQVVDQPMPQDFDPFVAMPAGTASRVASVAAAAPSATLRQKASMKSGASRMARYHRHDAPSNGIAM